MKKPSQNQPPAEEILTADQTQFSTEEPLYEAVSLPSKPEEEHAAATKPGKLSKQQLLLIGVAVTAGIVLLLVLLASAMRPPVMTEELKPTPSVEPINSDPMSQRISNLKKQVQAADPSLDKLPLPPVDLELRFEKQSSSN